ncbi:ribonuclease J [Candidatus Nomurabacteria bacterium CG10_big_fil_rev_8_21_14_0_10_03_31_7]|uniref:Ribonuclease J n=1 Tax=Candidatus Nomurabacteria bacterium CG10_big_fil_rev_8_21_14_0_10_03_31_7 TaxID=1974730 RepID=A0A2J0JH07_9BACT|nr:MAG: ribonuclease J [Candidatus Nomurabacteria bacterium CG10_big_fil_rev_8_21_14_0_10_03_31_7]
MKKTRLSFSSVMMEEKKENKIITNPHLQKIKIENKNGEKRKLIKSSTYQYRKKNYGKQIGGNRSFSNKNKYKNISENKIPPPKEGVIRIIPLGGVEEIGKNMTAIEIGNDIILIDAGMHFSNEDTPGVDYVIPNTTYLEEHKDKIRGLFITHGHLDHIGGVPLVLSRIGNPPVYSRNLSMLLMRKRQAEFPQLATMKENIVEKDDTVICGKIKIRFFGVTHTIPDSIGIIIETKNGWIVTPGDYKLDQVDGIVSNEEEKEYSIFDKAKVLLLMTDSTNIENEGFSLPEIKVHQGLENLIKKVSGRIIIAAFASHITRLTHVVKVAENLGKKIAIDGRSMKTNIEVAIEAGYFKPKKDTIIPIEEADKYPPNKVVILMTGSQGEEFAALSRAANKSHTKFSIKKGDTIILSSSVVPGNEIKVQRIKDNLSRQGVKIISYRTAGEDFVHATGHGNKEDIRWLHKKTHPKFFIPIHGNHFMLELHKELAIEVGILEEKIIVPDNGSIIEISSDGEKMTLRKEKAPSAPMMVDGLAISDVQDVVIRDRQMLAQDGMFVIIALVDQKTGKLKKSPDLISRGFVYLKENQELLRQVRIIIKKGVDDVVIKNNQVDLDYIKSNLGETVSKFLFQKTAKRPLVIPVVLSI